MAISKIPSAGFQDNVKFRNIIINGDMSIAQRGTSASSITSTNFYTVDRTKIFISNGGTWTQSQSTDVPTGQGFSNSLKMDCTTANASLSSGNNLTIQFPIEAQNLQYLKYGTASAQTLTLSFWVKSNKTGTYCISLQKTHNTRYDFVAEYSISSASTWEKKTITIAPDSQIKASGGAINNNNGEGFVLKFTLLSSGRTGTNNTWNSSTPADATTNQVNLADSTSNEWYITGVQLEAGTTASDFEFLPHDVNFQRCSRYYQLIASGTNKCIGDGGAYSGSNVWSFVHVKPFRTTPSIDIVTGSNYYAFIGNATSSNVSSVFVEGNSTETNIRIANTSASVTQGRSYFLNTNNSSAFIGFEAEL